jgi:hypothetical protein
MSTAAKRPSCGARFELEEKAAGKRARCPSCQGELAVRAAASAETVPPRIPSPGGEPRSVVPRCSDSGGPSRPTASNDGASESDAPPARRSKKPAFVPARLEFLQGLGGSAQGVMEAVAAMRSTLTEAQILAAFTGKIEPVRRTAIYRIWIATVALAMVPRVARFAFPVETFDDYDVADLLQMSESALHRLQGFYFRALGRLAITALEVEQALGLPPIESEQRESS